MAITKTRGETTTKYRDHTGGLQGSIHQRDDNGLWMLQDFTDGILVSVHETRELAEAEADPKFIPGLTAQPAGYPEPLHLDDGTGPLRFQQAGSGSALVSVSLGNSWYFLDSEERHQLMAWLRSFEDAEPLPALPIRNEAEARAVAGLLANHATERPVDHPMPTTADVLSDQIADRS